MHADDDDVNDIVVTKEIMRKLNAKTTCTLCNALKRKIQIKPSESLQKNT